MVTKSGLILTVTILGLTTTVGMVVFAIINERYLEAVAISCLVPVLTWFATGAGKFDK